MTVTATTEQDARRRRTVVWVVSLATVGLIFDGYDLVVYGVVMPIFLKDPSHIGALLAGSVGDIIGRRRVMLTAYAWFSTGMLLTALVSDATLFGVMRFITGLGIGALIATTGALVAEFAPPGKKNL